MTMKKVTLSYIVDDSDRKASFKKRRQGFLKKADELSTLCGVDVCAVIYSPYAEEPEVWPSRQGVETVLARFEKLSKIDQKKRMLNQESFIRQRITKARAQLQRIQKVNKRLDLEISLYKCIYEGASLDFDTNDTQELSCLVNQTLNQINSKMEEMKIAGQHLPDCLPLTLGTGQIKGLIR